jgi:hypothetical protein
MRHLDSLKRRLQALEPGSSAQDNWEEIRLAIVSALDDFPDAKLAIVEGIRADPNHGDMKWPDLRGVILNSLQPFPAARESVLAALKGVEA